MKICLTLLCCLWLTTSSLFGQAGGWFNSQEITTVTLRTDMKAFLADRGDNPAEHPAWISVETASGKEVVEVDLKAGGNFRKHPSHCTYPPLRIDPKSKSALGTLFEGQGNMKVITLCQDPVYVMKEYLAYRLYNVMTDSSYQVRFGKIVFEDIAQRIPEETNWAFWVEGEKHLSKRLGLDRVESDTVFHTEDLKPYTWARLCVFQYMIGNTDWDLSLRKNLTFLQSDSNTVAIPFDFDWSKWVDAAYTGLKDDPTFNHRLFRAKGLTRSEVAITLDRAIAKKELLLEEIKAVKSLPAEHKRVLNAYLDEFFKEAEDPKLREEHFLSRCLPDH